MELRDCDLDKLDSSSACVELRDRDVDRFDKMGNGTTTGMDGGALLGGEPEDSRFVAKKNSSTEPALFFSRGTNKKNIRKLSKFQI